MPDATADDDAQDLLDASLALARTQLIGQLTDETSLDGRTMGTLGFGPHADEFYNTFLGQPSTPAREQLLDGLGEAFSNNARRLEAKQRALRAALIVLAVGLIAAALLIGLG